MVHNIVRLIANNLKEKQIMKIFNLKSLQKPSFFQRLFKSQPSENAIIEVNNLLAKNEPDIKQISVDDVIEISDRYNTDLRRKFKARRIELFTDYLHYCLSDSRLTDREMEQLYHLRDVLMLSEVDVNEVIEQESAKVYAKHVRAAVSDGELAEVEKQNLERLKNELLLSKEVANEIYSKSASEILQRFVDGAISDERISPDEERQLNQIARNLGIDLQMDEKSRAVLDRYKLYWQIENGDLPTINPDINIQKSEQLYFTTFVHWLEERKVVKRRNYAGPTARIKLAKGVYYRLGSLRTNNMSNDEWRRIDSGRIYLTNKRLIFMGAKGNKTIRLNSILAINPFSNGVDIQKERGKSPFLEFSNDVDIFSMIMTRLMDE